MTDWDKISASAPVDRIAAMSCAKGPEWVRKHNPDNLTSASPLKCLPHPNDPSFKNLAGSKVGKITAIGLLDGDFYGLAKPGKRGARWVVRCACGIYEVRRTKFFTRDPKEKPGMHQCACCEYETSLKRGFFSQAVIPLSE